MGKIMALDAPPKKCCTATEGDAEVFSRSTTTTNTAKLLLNKWALIVALFHEEKWNVVGKS